MAVIGDPAAVELFLKSEGLESAGVAMKAPAIALVTGGAVLQHGAEVASTSGRWLKLTDESFDAIKKYGLRQNSRGLSTGVLKGEKGRIKGFVEFSKRPGSMVSNPSVMAGAAGVMTQLAMQQAMTEITDYLATIDEKLDDVLRAHQDAVLADVIGVGLDLDEAMLLREHGGRVNEVTWSKVQASSSTVAKTQVYALRQLDSLAEKVERASRLGDQARAAEAASGKVQEWLSVLARCLQLQDAIAVLELDRVLDAAPEDLDGHRRGLQAARQKRLETITQTTERLMDRMNAAAAGANLKVLLHPSTSREVVHATNDVSGRVLVLHETLGIEGGRTSLEARRWRDAAAEQRGKIVLAGKEGVLTARRVGGDNLGRAKDLGESIGGRASQAIAERRQRRMGKRDDEEH